MTSFYFLLFKKILSFHLSILFTCVCMRTSGVVSLAHMCVYADKWGHLSHAHVCVCGQVGSSLLCTCVCMWTSGVVSCAHVCVCGQAGSSISCNMCMYVDKWEHLSRAHVCMCMWTSGVREQFSEVSFLLPPCQAGNWTQVIRVRAKCLSLVNHPASPAPRHCYSMGALYFSSLLPVCFCLLNSNFSYA